MATVSESGNVVDLLGELLELDDHRITHAVGFMYTLKARREICRKLMDLYDKQGVPLELLDRQREELWRGLAKLPQPSLDSICRTLGTIPRGIAFIIRLREQVLTKLTLKSLDPAIREDLRMLDAFMRSAMTRQVAVEMRSISSDSPEPLLAFLEAHEAVHPIRDRADLHFRLSAPGRQCFGLFHAFMPQEPLVVLQLAVLDSPHPPEAISDVLEPGNLQPAWYPLTVAFYSVTNTMPGLAGLQLASLLLFLVMEHLQHVYPSVVNFVTLSPAPCLATWALTQLRKRDPWMLAIPHSTPESAQDPFSDLESRINNGINASFAAQCDRFGKEERSLLLRWTSRYIMFERRSDGRKCVDPVANFHITNGATVERINFGSNFSRKALQNSFGIMVNYRYDLSKAGIEARRYAKNGTLAATQAALLFQSLGFPSVFQGLDTSTLVAMRVPLSARIVPPQTWLFRADDTTTHAFYILILGELEVYRNESQPGAPTGLVRIGTMAVGSAVGALPILEGRDPFCYIRSTGVCYVLQAPIDIIGQMQSRFPAEARIIRKNAKKQLRVAMERFTDSHRSSERMTPRL